MRAIRSSLLLPTVFLLVSSSLRAQSAADPSGHWEGAIKVPDRGDVVIEVDFTKSSKGALAGTFGNPSQRVKGLPLAGIVVDGRVVRFVLNAGNGGGAFEGTLAADGKSIAGDFITAEGNYKVPFSVTRTGDAKIEETAKIAAIAKELEGSWSGSVDAGGQELQVVVKLANQADGTSSGTIATAGQGAEIPISGIKQVGTSVTLDVKIIGGSFVGTMNAAGTEMTGIWNQGPASLPLILKRAK